MGSPLAPLYLFWVQLETWTGNVEFLRAEGHCRNGERFHLVLWRLDAYSKLCDTRTAMPFPPRFVTPPNEDMPVRFRRLSQGFYCFTVAPRGSSNYTARSPVTSVAGQPPRDRCCQTRQVSLLWRASEDGVLSASLKVQNTSWSSCGVFLVRVWDAPRGFGDVPCKDFNASSEPLVEYQVVKNSVVHVRKLNRSRRFCLAATAGCFKCPETCPDLVRTLVDFDGARAGPEVLPEESPLAVSSTRGTFLVAIPVVKTALDPILIVLGSGSVVFLLVWIWLFLRRATNAAAYARGSPTFRCYKV